MCVVSLLQGIMFNLVPLLQGVDILGKTLFHCLCFSVVSVFPCLVVLANASVSDPIALLSTRALARSESQRGSFGSTTLGCTLAGLGGLLYLFLLLPT